MTRGAVAQAAPQRRTRVLRQSAVLVVLVVLVLAGTAYYVLGWHAMEAGCGTGPENARASVSYSWSWDPVGFRCDYGDGTSEVSVWP